MTVPPRHLIVAGERIINIHKLCNPNCCLYSNLSEAMKPGYIGDMTTIDAFRGSVSAATPPPDAGPALQALWWLAHGDWERAHECVQSHEGEPDCDRVHAHLHRQEGDLNNAGWWYRRVGRSVPDQSLEEEWTSLATELLAGR